MFTLHDNAFSPFARKVRIILEHKGIAHDVIDGLAVVNRERLTAVNTRVEVPALDHNGLIVAGSADIALYLERVAPQPAIYPDDPVEWAQAKAWERCADTAIDPVLINISYWMWAERSDTQPDSWLAAARRDMAQVYQALERDLTGRSFVAGQLSIADIALFPHLTATRAFGLGHDPEKHPRLHAWLRRLRAMPVFARDLERTKAFVAKMATANQHERRKIFYRGDRIEWLLANGFHAWLANEIAEDRVLWPGFGVPGPGPERRDAV